MITTTVRPTALTLGQEVRIWYMLVAALKGICAKLDDDGGVADTDYEANCYTAIINTKIRDQYGNETGVLSDERYFHNVSPSGLTHAARIELMYNLGYAIYTLCTQLDSDGTVNDTDYAANCYTAMFLHQVKNARGSTIGYGTSYWFTPAGSDSRKELIDWFYNVFNAIETLTEQLDADAGVTDTNYEALWYTAAITMKVVNSAGNTMGN